MTNTALKVFNDNDFSAVVDQLADVKAKIADLQKLEDELKLQLTASGFQHIDGINHRAAISFVEGRAVTDWRKIALRFEPSHQLVRANTKTTAGHWQVKVSARKTSN